MNKALNRERRSREATEERLVVAVQKNAEAEQHIASLTAERDDLCSRLESLRREFHASSSSASNRLWSHEPEPSHEWNATPAASLKPRIVELMTRDIMNQFSAFVMSNVNSSIEEEVQKWVGSAYSTMTPPQGYPGPSNVHHQRSEASGSGNTREAGSSTAGQLDDSPGASRSTEKGKARMTAEEFQSFAYMTQGTQTSASDDFEAEDTTRR